jgi:hypothetical protein
MEPFVVTLGNVLMTIWIAGGFLALLLLTQGEPVASTSQGAELAASPVAKPSGESRSSEQRRIPAQAVRDVYWERHHRRFTDRSERAA